MLMTKEHYDLMGQFEREHRGRRMDRESKESWPRGIIYQDGHVNELFAAYRRGYAFAVADYRSDLQNLEASRDGYRCDAERLQTEIDTLKASKAEHSEEGTPPASAQDDAKDETPAAWLLTNIRLGRTWASIVSPFPGEIDELNSQGITAEPLYRRPATAAGDARDEPVPEWAACESRRPWATNSLKASAQALREKETRLRTAYTKDFMGVPSRFVADAYGEAAAVFEAKLDLIAASEQQEG